MNLTTVVNSATGLDLILHNAMPKGKTKDKYDLFALKDFDGIDVLVHQGVKHARAVELHVTTGGVRSEITITPCDDIVDKGGVGLSEDSQNLYLKVWDNKGGIVKFTSTLAR